MKIIILGLPGAGKGTQAELLAKKLNLPRLSVGAILRRVSQEKGPKNQEIGQIMNKGFNVPAKLLFEILKPWFRQHPQGFVVDNLPRSHEQFVAFKDFLKKTGLKIDKVFHLTISEEEAIRRINLRHQERIAKGQGRLDDEPKIIKTRIEEGYQKEIGPILDFFKNMGVLVEINAEQDIAKIQQDILDHLKIK